MFNKFKLYISIFFYITNAIRKYITYPFTLKKERRKIKKTKINAAFFNIKNLPNIFKILTKLSISNYTLVLLNKLPVLFLKSDKFFVKVLQKTSAPSVDYYSNSFEVLSKAYNENPRYFTKPYKYYDDGIFFYHIVENINANSLNKDTLKEIQKLPTKTKGILLNQIKDIINILCTLDIVHTDIFYYNILFDKKEMRLVLIDFDNSFYAKENPDRHFDKNLRLEMDIKNLKDISADISDNSPENIKIKEEIINIANYKYKNLLK